MQVTSYMSVTTNNQPVSKRANTIQSVHLHTGLMHIEETHLVEGYPVAHYTSRSEPHQQASPPHSSPEASEHRQALGGRARSNLCLFWTSGLFHLCPLSSEPSTGLVFHDYLRPTPSSHEHVDEGLLISFLSCTLLVCTRRFPPVKYSTCRASLHGLTGRE